MGSNATRRLDEILGGGAAMEAEVMRNPYSVRAWMQHLKAANGSPLTARRLIYELALRFVPRSYKLWYQYLNELNESLNERYLSSNRAEVTARTYERALVHMHKMPRIWLDYCALLRGMRKTTELRHAFDRCLRALPITQHDKVWPEFVEWASKDLCVEATAVVAFQRYVMFEPARREALVDYLFTAGRFGEAASELATCVNDDDFLSPSGKSKHQLWMRLCDVCAAHPQLLPQSLNVDAIIRSGLSRFTDEVGRLWCKLADYYIRLGSFERARDVYEEACTTVVTVRDFSMAFDAYAAFEESVLTAKMQMMDDDDDDDDENDDEDDDVELRLARLERLMARRPLLLSSVLLRQNPHAVAEWHARAALVADDPLLAIECYSDAVKTVDPALAAGKPHTLWIAFAKYYEDRGDLANARVILETATQQPLRTVDDVAAVFCWWAEMELRHGNHDEALEVMHRAVLQPAASSRDRDERASVAERVHRSPKLWALYLDLEESLGTLDSARAAYDRALELRVATPQMVLNYAQLLNDASYFEESFRAYERGVALFKWPHVRDLWKCYLASFVERYGGTKLERARDLFEQALAKAPPMDAARLFVDYAKLEETHGLARRAIAVYERAANAAKVDHEFDAFSLYIAKVEQAFGATKARPIYEAAIKKLKRDGDAKRMCSKFAVLETKLGEIDRARAVLTHGSQFADPRRDALYWDAWRDFEVAHGNEETFREMLRVKRSVEMALSLANFVADDLLHTDEPELSDADAHAKHLRDTGGITPALGFDPSAGARKRKADAGGAEETQIQALERQAAKIVEAAKLGAKAAADPNEIDLDDDDDAPAAAGAAGDVVLTSRPIPAAVFGSAVDHAAASSALAAVEQEKATALGALARFKTQQS
ncbi:hypothetical protein M885DRAFT_621310 [Pelagophyceae sp. CCMP2097]|nr:hypothetical protein M885DRAFT_621310 [Pelagophyceae sp. CCMP2097]